MIFVLMKVLLWIGKIERKYIEVPVGATWAEATLRASGFDTARRFFVDAVQVHYAVRISF